MNEALNNSNARAWDIKESTFGAYAAKRHVPLGATFELTARCSLKCNMCYVRLDGSQVDALGRELTAEEWIRMGRDAANAGTVNLLLTGGEPLLRKDFAEIYSAYCQMGFIITLNTNATLMSEEYFKLFSKYPPTAVAVTLYGAAPETYKKICGDAAGFEKTIRGLELLAKLPMNIEIRTTFTKDNMHELDAIRAIANRYTKRFGINTMIFKAVRGAAANVELCRMSPEQCLDIDMANYKYYDDLARAEQKPVPDAMEETPPAVSREEEQLSERDYGLDLPPKVITCLASKSIFWISWDGKMLPCGSFTTPYTLPLEEGFVSAWNRLPALLEDVEHPAECLSCELLSSCPNCPANIQAETGVFDEVAPYLCAFSKERARRYKLGY